MPTIKKTTMFIRNIGPSQITFDIELKVSVIELMEDFGILKVYNKEFNTAITWKYDKDLNKRILTDTPKYQRLDKADLPWRQGIINSILNNIPFPDLYFRHDTKPNSNYTKEIVDGGHRLRTVGMFLLNEFKLPNNYKVKLEGVKELIDCSGLFFYQLDKRVQKKIERHNFTVQTFNSNDWVAAQMFSLINNGNEMSRQEIRSAIETDLANTIRKLASTIEHSRGGDISNQHRIFKEGLVDFKLTNLDWDMALAQMVLFSSESKCERVDGNALDEFYLNPIYWGREDLDKEYPEYVVKRKELMETFRLNLHDVGEVLSLRPDGNKVLKNYFVNLYFFIAELKSLGYTIVDHTKLSKQYYKDENERINRKEDLKTTNGVKVGTFSLYSHLTGREGGKKIRERVKYLLTEFYNNEPSDYGVEKNES